jgi:hypothetical protein
MQKIEFEYLFTKKKNIYSDMCEKLWNMQNSFSKYLIEKLNEK